MMVPSRSRNTARSKDLFTRRSQHLPRGREYITGADATHTGMVERALAEAARSAPGLVSQNRGSCLAASGSWRSQAIVGRAEHARHVDSDRGSEMQCTGVVRDQRAAMNEHTRKAGNVGAIYEVDESRASAKLAHNLSCCRTIGRDPQHDRRDAVFGQPCDEIGEG